MPVKEQEGAGESTTMQAGHWKQGETIGGLGRETLNLHGVLRKTQPGLCLWIPEQKMFIVHCKTLEKGNVGRSVYHV